LRACASDWRAMPSPSCAKRPSAPISASPRSSTWGTRTFCANWCAATARRSRNQEVARSGPRQSDVKCKCFSCNGFSRRLSNRAANLLRCANLIEAAGMPRLPSKQAGYMRADQFPSSSRACKRRRVHTRTKSTTTPIMSKLGVMSSTRAASIAVTRGVVTDVRPPRAPRCPCAGSRPRRGLSSPYVARSYVREPPAQARALPRSRTQCTTGNTCGCWRSKPTIARA